jgi:hypothetical protein
MRRSPALFDVICHLPGIQTPRYAGDAKDVGREKRDARIAEQGTNMIAILFKRGWFILRIPCYRPSCYRNIALRMGMGEYAYPILTAVLWVSG